MLLFLALASDVDNGCETGLVNVASWLVVDLEPNGRDKDCWGTVEEEVGAVDGTSGTCMSVALPKFEEDPIGNVATIPNFV